MGIRVQMGVEFTARHRDRYVNIIWSLRGFSGTREFLDFLSRPDVVELMTAGRRVAEYQQRHVLAVFDRFNQRHLAEINREFGLNIPPLDPEAFRIYVGPGQFSLLHLAKFAHEHLLPHFATRYRELEAAPEEAPPEERQAIRDLMARLDAMDSEILHERYLCRQANPDLADPVVAVGDASLPEMMTMSPGRLTAWLYRLHAGSRVTLNLSGLPPEDVLEILYECRGGITHLEIFNLKDHIAGHDEAAPAVNCLQRALNTGNVLQIKRLVRGMIACVEAAGGPDADQRVESLTGILRQVGELQASYQKVPLGSRIGSDSTGRSTRVPGMGLAVVDTLPQAARRFLAGKQMHGYRLMPVNLPVARRTMYRITDPASRTAAVLFNGLRRLPGLRFLAAETREEWVAEPAEARLGKPGNTVSLGGPRDRQGNGFSAEKQEDCPGDRPNWPYLRSSLKNGLKVLIGFIPAFLTFLLTKDWWLLAWGGAVIWFGITGLRNVLQSVLGGGGIRRSPLLRWKDYVSWSRLADSLMYTGFSVPLLDFLVKTLLLEQGLGITTHTSPTLLYAIMALVNGAYLSTHNLLRGLPRSAVYGNFFRSMFSIPLAVAINDAAFVILAPMGEIAADALLQKWAAIISKFASDCVAGCIEGFADRRQNIRVRYLEYRDKLAQVFDTFDRLEVLFPEEDVLEMMSSPKEFLRSAPGSAEDLIKVLIVNSLDLLYFWMYRPRARTVFRRIFKTLSEDERQVLVRSQLVLLRHREVSRMFVDGLVGKKFARALAFYLDRSGSYLAYLQRMAETHSAEHHGPANGVSRVPRDG